MDRREAIKGIGRLVTQQGRQCGKQIRLMAGIKKAPVGLWYRPDITEPIPVGTEIDYVIEHWNEPWADDKQ